MLGKDATRTTLRISSAILNEAKQMALDKKMALQDVIEGLLIKGLGDNRSKERKLMAAKKILDFQKSMQSTNITAEEVLELNRKQLK